MKTFTSINVTADTQSVVALGCFDGVHTGHVQVIKKARDIANELSLPLTVWSFTEPPRNFFIPRSVPLLTDKKEKSALMRKLGVDVFFCVPFDETIASMSAESFFYDLLLNKLHATH